MGLLRQFGKALKDQQKALREGDPNWMTPWSRSPGSSGTGGTGGSNEPGDEWKLIHKKFRQVMGREPYSKQELVDWWSS